MKAGWKTERVEVCSELDRRGAPRTALRGSSSAVCKPPVLCPTSARRCDAPGWSPRLRRRGGTAPAATTPSVCLTAPRMQTNALNWTLLFRWLRFQFPAIKNKFSCTLTLLMSTAPPLRTPSMMGSKLLAVQSRSLACSMSFFCLACRAAFRYCFFLPSRNSSCAAAGGQRKTIEYNLWTVRPGGGAKSSPGEP